MIALWYTEAGKYNVLPLDSRGTMRFADERPQIAAERDSYVYYPRHPGGSGERRSQGAQPRAHHHRRRRARATVTRVYWSATAAMSVATRCSSRTGSCTTCTTTSAREELRVSSDKPVPPGKHLLRYEFEPTGAPDLQSRQGYAGYGEALRRRRTGRDRRDFPVTVPLALGLGSGLAVGRNPGSAVSRDVRAAVRVHRHDHVR